MPLGARTNWASQPWMLVEHNDLEVEWQQATEEGRDLASVEAEFADLRASQLDTEELRVRAEALLDRVQELPLVAGYAHEEPSDLDGIRAVRPEAALPPKGRPDRATLEDKALGAWCGRASGCLLGKPAEGRRRWQIEKYLKAQSRWPLDDYFSLQADAELARECGFDLSWRAAYTEGIDHMPEDDDTNYTVTGLAIYKQSGPGFTPVDVARFWLSNIPIFHVCTAERVAYRNLVDGIGPPASAACRNVYREWIGAQIRADFFGYVCPGDPERAAGLAWRDACISHVKNGIYGEMWVAAMLAAAYVTDDPEAVIRAGMAQIPARCRLTAGLEHVLGLWQRRVDYWEAVEDLHARWKEDRSHDWCHTISNAEVVAMALLWGERDFGRTICYSVMPGFDTDCNGATSGSVLGLMLGRKALPERWIAPMNDTLMTGVAGYHKVSLTAVAQETVELMG